MQSIPDRLVALAKAAPILALGTSCGAGLNQTSITCSEGRTLLDGVCVSEQVADYVSCVRAQGAQLGAEKGQRISAEVGYLGAKAGGAAELNETLQKKYSASDQAMLAIIQACSGASQLEASAGNGKGPGKSLAAHWTLDEAGGNGASDASGHGNTGTVQGPVAWAPGRVGGAIKLDGGGFVEIGDNPSQHAPRAVTLTGWGLLTEKDLGHPWRSVLMKSNEKNGDWTGCGNPGSDLGPNPCDAREYGIWVNAAERYVMVVTVTEDRVNNGGQSFCNTEPGTVQFGRWHHFGAVISSQGRAIKVFLDGTLMASCPISEAGIRKTSQYTRIGAAWVGMLDEVRIYGAELTDAEIARLATAK